MTLTRRSALHLLTAGAAVTVAAACAPITNTPPAAVSSPAPAAGATPAASTPRKGGTLRLALTSDLSGLDGHLLSRDQYDSVWNVWDRLTEYNEKLEIQPRLVESWDVNGDATQYKLNLRKGVQWHTGRDFTSDDVKWNLIRVKDPKAGIGQLKSLGDAFQSIDTPDKYTVVLQSDTPRPTVFDYFELFNIIDPENAQGPNAQTKAVGTGPFKFDEWQQGVSLKLSKNANYWDSGKPLLDGITWSLKLDPQGMVVQLEANQLDGMKAPPVNDFVRLKNDPKYQSLTHPATGAYYVVGFNCTQPPFDNPKVRQAFNWALNRKRFTDQVLKGIVSPLSLPWPMSSGAYEASKANYYSYDLNKAGALLKEAGVSGLETTLLLNTGLQELIDFAPIYQADLASLGVKMNIQVVEVAAWIDAVNTLKYNAVYASTGSFSQLRSPSIMFTSGPVWGPTVNNTGFKDAHYTDLVNQSGLAVDPTQQKQIYSQLNDMLLDQTFVTPLAPNPPRETFRSAVKGVAYSAHEGFVYTAAYLDN